MVSYRYLGYGVTDSNGVAHLDHDANGDPLTHSYTGVGAGEIDVVASLDNPVSSGSIVSETYEIWDYIRYDYGTDTNHNDIWDTNTTTTSVEVTRGSEYTEFKELTSANLTNGFTIPDQCVIEFDFYQVDGYRTQNFFQLIDGSSTNLFSKTLNDIGGFTGSWFALKIEINGTTAKITNTTTGDYVEDDNLSATPTKFVLWGASGITTLRFKNMRVYPL